MNTRFPRTRIAAAIGGLALTLGAGHAIGAGFALQETSGSGLGNAFAGGAAAAEDASTVWANPAGMSQIKTNQIVGALSFVRPGMKLSNGNSQAALNQPLGDDGGDAGSMNYIPALYAVLPINKQWSFGLGINAPFGLVTEYDDAFIGRYQGVKSDVKTININPALSWQIADNFTIGIGASYQQLKGTFTSHANYSAGLYKAAATAEALGKLPAGTAAQVFKVTPGLDSVANVTGEDYSWGWNAGILWNIDQKSRIGVAWRSDINFNLSGNAQFTNPTMPSTVPDPLKPVVGSLMQVVNTAGFYNSGITSNIKVPGIANVSYFNAIDPKWDVMFDAQWTHWSVLPALIFTRTDGATLVNTPLQFKDAWRFSAGANYKYSDQWKFRGGIAYDQSPVQDADRTVRLPDNNRTWLSLGAQYSLDKAWKFDVGGTYIWVANGSINNGGNDPATNQPNPAAYGLVNGSYSNYVWILAGQVTYSF